MHDAYTSPHPAHRLARGVVDEQPQSGPAAQVVRERDDADSADRATFDYGRFEQRGSGLAIASVGQHRLGTPDAGRGHEVVGDQAVRLAVHLGG